MIPFTSYLLQSTISISIFYLMYKILMSNMPSHSLNRMLMIGMLLGSVCMPFVKFSVFPEAAPLVPLNLLRDFIVPVPDNMVVGPSQLYQSGIVEIGLLSLSLMGIYFLAMSILFLRLLFGLGKVFRIIRKSKYIVSDDVKVFLVSGRIQPFTFMKNIVMSEEDFKTNGELIIAHEKEHIRQNHTFDLILLEVFTLFYWFNPLMWLIRQDLKLIHEYQADKAAINTGIDAQTYQLLVLEKAVGERRFALANQFIQQPLLKRFKMIQKKNKPRWVGLKLLFFVPVILLLLQAFTRTDVISKVSSTITSEPAFAATSEKKSLFETPQEEKRATKNSPTEFWNIVDDNVSPQKEKNATKNSPTEILNIVEDNVDTGKKPTAIKERNVMIILINARNEFFAEGEKTEFKDVIEGADNFLHGKAVFFPKGKSPEFISTSLEGLGPVNISKGIISIQYNKGTDPMVVKDLIEGIRERYAVVLNEKSQIYYQKKYSEISEDKQEVLRTLIPLKVNLAAPKPPPSVK